MTAGVPQGSVLGPLLWNIFDDEVLRMVGYADDLAVIVIGKSKEDLRERTEEALRLVGAWMGDNGLSIAPDKSEPVLLVGRRTIREMSVCMEGRMIETREAVRYLGVEFQRNLRVAEQVERVVLKAKMVVGALGRLLPNCRPWDLVWGGGVDRWIPHTEVSTDASGFPEKHASASMLCVPHGVRGGKNERVRESSSAPSVACKGKARKDLMQAWCERWRQTEKAAWTRRLIPNLAEWVGRGHGEVNHYTSQVPIGHRSFGAYLKRIGKTECSACWYCEEGVEEDVEHAIFDCDRWARVREECEMELGMRVDADNMIDKMLENNEEGSIAIERMLITIMKEKCDYERKRERREEVRGE
ncbi:hypothetical protein Zmor_010541 [Zophobas morio]|uniref:Reverse transcriptase domain-containing protein n=1 Tax=Zophobas morio TaxID=2755281 RepID=A0AA38MIX1_9CUCU|nr:hypothetical protein Zmor_010541 [Zophobas morio]